MIFRRKAKDEPIDEPADESTEQSDAELTDADGWLKARGSGSKGGHAICGCALENRSGTWGIKIANSWGTAWGRNGFGVLPEQRCAEGTQVFRWWALREVVQESGDLPVPKFN